MSGIKFQSGDIVAHYSNINIKIVILWPLKLKWRGCQRYRVSFYDDKRFHVSTAYEQELKKLKEYQNHV